MTDYIALPLADVTGWAVDLAASKTTELPVDSFATALIDAQTQLATSSD